MRIQYLGHSAFRLLSDGFSHSIICDPYSEESVGEKMPYLSADLVTVSHRHADHDYVRGVKGDPTIADSVGEGLFDDITVKTIECFHDDAGGKKRGKNLVTVFGIDGIKIAHMGDVGEQNIALAEKLKGVDVLLVPVGGVYTIDALAAKWYCNLIQPSVVIPMHYKRGNVTLNIKPVEDFLDLFDESAVSYVGDTLTLDVLPETQKVYVMEKYQD